MSSSVFKVYSEEDRNVVLPEPLNLDDSAVSDGTSAGEPTSGTSSSASGIPTVVDERLKIDSNLVIVVGKDGSVHVDQKTLHDLLANETTDTSVSVVRIASPTPSIEDEIEQERRLAAQEAKLHQDLEAAGLVPDDATDSTGSDEASSEDTVPTPTLPTPVAAAGPSGVSTRRSKAAPPAAAKKDDVLLEGGDPPHVSLMVEGFYPPEEAKKFAEEVLTLAGLRKPLTVETEPVDYEFQRYVVANDHCYTPLTSPSQKLPSRSYYEEQQQQVEPATASAAAEVVPEVVPATPVQVEEEPSGRRRAAAAPKVSPTTTAAKARQRRKSVSQREESSSNDAEDLQSILEGSDSDSDYTEESSYPEEDDNESDLDFDISGKAQSASKKRKSGSKNRKKKAEEQVEAKKKVVAKTPTKKVEIKLVTPVSMVTKSAVPKTYGPKKTVEVVPVQPPVQPVAPPAPPVVKKPKPVPKPAPHVEALFSDMTSLFSTPDIIKKVGQSKAITPVTPTPTPSSSRGFVQLSKGTLQKLPAQISIQTHTSASEENLIDVLAAQDPEPTPATSTTPTPLAEDIVKMLENNLPPGGVQEPVLPITDNSILAALGSNDDGGLPEDLLQHVAELAENKELQEILDKQVLGVIADVPPIPTMPSTSAVIPIAPQQMLQPVIAPPQPVLPRPQPQPQTPTAAESLPTMTVKEQLMPRKEAIQIRRSDGRIITLPPIEAPATRSKRRAQTTPSSSPAVSATPSTPSQPSATTPSTPLNTPQSSKSSTSSKVSSVKTPSTPVGITSYDDGSGSLLIDETRGKSGNRSAASSRRTSESSNNSGRGKRQSTAAVAAVVAAEAAEDEVESDESWNSEDDPDRLWCICRQPHNNRFMICCDVCEDWFHGKCVNITKAMGQQMEADGIEWTCPNCLKKKQDKQQPKMTDFLVSSSSSASSIGTGSASAIKMSPKTVASITAAAAATATVTATDHTPTSCVVCAKVARANSVYCSDACIRKHAGISSSSMPKAAAAAEVTQPAAKVTKEVGKQQQTIVDGIKKLEGAGKGAVANAKSGPIIVMERKTGRCLTGKNAPTAENLKAWLQSHPTFEVVPPGSPQAAIILAKQAEVRKLQQAKESQKKLATATASTSKAQSKHSDKKNTLFSPSIPQKVTTQVTPQSSKAPSKASSKTSISTPTTTTTTMATGKGSPVTTAAPKSSSSSSSLGGGAKTPSSSTVASKAQKRPATTPETKSSAPAAKTTPPAAAAATSAGGENIRVTVKKTLKEHLLQRTSEIDPATVSARLTEPEIDRFVAAVEEEMFAMFNKDTGTKYRAKYRTLVFNIKDRKNLSLFQKICEKRIEGKQLVRMTPEELASQELAQWRENEAKHQLEMIKKSELDLLACAKNYVLKTHKGEEVIEGKIDDRVQLDPTTAVEDVVAVLNNSTVSSTSELDASSTKDASFSRSKDFDLSFGGKYSTGLYGSGSITSSTLASSTATTSSKKKDSRRSRSRSRSRDRRRDRSRDRSRSRHKRRRSRSRSRHGSKDRDRARSRHREHRKQESRDGKMDEKVAATAASVDRNEAVGKPVEAKKPKKLEGKSQVPESGNLIDQILASAGAAVNKPPSEAATEKEITPVMAPEEPPKRTTSPISATTASPSDNQDQEPTSTVTIPTPPHSTEFDSESPSTDFGTSEELATDTRKEALKIHWTGNVHMVDVASVEMSIRSVSGNIEDVAQDFSEDLDICGTIKPEIVWDYIGQIKKSANKEICLVRFHSNERAAYYTLYTHLFSRKRYSVIKSPSKAIKDFYVFPLPSEQMIPMILKPLNGVGIIEGDKKPDLLLGIIVKVWGKRSSTVAAMASSSAGSSVAKTPRRSGKSSSTAVSPSFALMQQVITKYATVNKKSAAAADLDATPPGSPGTAPAPPPPPPSTAVPKLPLPPLPPGPAAAAAAVATPPPPPSSAPVVIRSRSASDSPEQVEIDMDIIKRPAIKGLSTVVTEAAPPPPVVIDDDDDEPYSPGGASDDSDQFADVTAIVDTKRRGSTAAVVDPEAERIRLEMEEINRKIAEEKNEIVGILSSAELKADEIKSTLTPSLITDISIPSNLSEILASINKSTAPVEPAKTTSKPAEDEEEYVPTAPSLYSSYKSGYSYGKSTPATPIPVLVSNAEPGGTSSKLSKLSDAELLSMVPDESYLQPAAATSSKASRPIVDEDVVELDSDDSDPPPQKKSKWSAADPSEPPPPGLEDAIDLE